MNMAVLGTKKVGNPWSRLLGGAAQNPTHETPLVAGSFTAAQVVLLTEGNGWVESPSVEIPFPVPGFFVTFDELNGRP
jgi:hypothetical protein